MDTSVQALTPRRLCALSLLAALAAEGPTLAQPAPAGQSATGAASERPAMPSGGKTAGNTTAAAEPLPITFEVTEIDLGEIPDYEPVTRAFKFTNTGKRPVGVFADHCKFCDPPVIEPRLVPAGRSGVVLLTVNPWDRVGEVGAGVSVGVTGSSAPTQPISLRAKVRREVWAEPRRVFINALPVGAGEVRTMKVYSRSADVKVLSVDTRSEVITAVIDEPAEELLHGETVYATPVHLRLSKDAPISAHGGEVQVQTNHPKMPMVPHDYYVTVVGDVRADPPELRSPWTKRGEAWSSLATLSTHSGKPVVVGAVEAQGPDAAGVTLTAEPGGRGTWMIMASGVGPATPGTLRFQAVVTLTSHPDERLVIPGSVLVP